MLCHMCVCVCDCQVHAVSFGIFISVLVMRGIGDEGRGGQVTPHVSPRFSATTCARVHIRKSLWRCRLLFLHKMSVEYFIWCFCQGWRSSNRPIDYVCVNSSDIIHLFHNIGNVAQSDKTQIIIQIRWIRWIKTRRDVHFYQKKKYI